MPPQLRPQHHAQLRVLRRVRPLRIRPLPRPTRRFAAGRQMWSFALVYDGGAGNLMSQQPAQPLVTHARPPPQPQPRTRQIQRCLQRRCQHLTRPPHRHHRPCRRPPFLLYFRVVMGRLTHHIALVCYLRAPSRTFRSFVPSRVVHALRPQRRLPLRPHRSPPHRHQLRIPAQCQARRRPP